MRDEPSEFALGTSSEKTQEIHVRLFGAFRDLEIAGVLKINVKLPVRVPDLKRQISGVLAGYRTTEVDFHSLLQTSALATASSVLNDHDVVTTAEDLALLPPVCGG